jgi:hypothetical protein
VACASVKTREPAMAGAVTWKRTRLEGAVSGRGNVERRRGCAGKSSAGVGVASEGSERGGSSRSCGGGLAGGQGAAVDLVTWRWA